MLSNVKNILVAIVHEALEEETSCAFAYALSLARDAEARITVQAASARIVGAHSLVSNFATRLAGDENRRLKALAEVSANNARAAADLAGIVCTTESPHLSYNDLVAKFIAQARVHDLAVLDAEPAVVSADRGIIEAALFDSGRPAIVVPPGADSFRGGRIAVAWDGSEKAARALNDAMPFLRAARHVEIVSVMGEKDLGKLVPGAEVAPHLTAHGISATVVDIVAEDGDVAEALRRHTRNSGTDILVMGAFAHSWIRQVVLGGVTQSLLKATPLPLFLSF